MTDPFCIPALAGVLDDIPFEPFRGGVEIHYIKSGSPAVALLRYAPGANVPRHLHTGLETILVLEGAQLDERGKYQAGDFVLTPKDPRIRCGQNTGALC